MHSPDHSTKGTPSALGGGKPQWPLAAGEDEVSGTVSSPLRGTFHLSLTVLVHYRSLKVFSLGEWSPQLPTRFHVPRGTQDANRSGTVVLYGTLTGSGAAFQPLRVAEPDVLLVLQLQPIARRVCLVSSRFARHFYGMLLLIFFCCDIVYILIS